VEVPAPRLVFPGPRGNRGIDRKHLNRDPMPVRNYVVDVKGQRVNGSR